MVDVSRNAKTPHAVWGAGPLESILSARSARGSPANEDGRHPRAEHGRGRGGHRGIEHEADESLAALPADPQAPILDRDPTDGVMPGAAGDRGNAAYHGNSMLACSDFAPPP